MAEPPQNQSKTLGIVSLVLGILALLTSCGNFIPGFGYVCCCTTPLLGIAGIICGAMGIKTPAKTMAIIGIVLAVLSFLAILVVFVINILRSPEMYQGIINSL